MQNNHLPHPFGEMYPQPSLIIIIVVLVFILIINNICKMYPLPLLLAQTHNHQGSELAHVGRRSVDKEQLCELYVGLYLYLYIRFYIIYVFVCVRASLCVYYVYPEIIMSTY